MSSLNKAEDEFYTYRETTRTFDDKKRKMLSVVRALKKKQQKKEQDTLERLKECENMELYRTKGELLTANLYKLEKGMKECTLENWYSPDGSSLKISLDETLSPAQNAQRYFKTYAKLKRTKEALEPRRKEEEEEAEYTDSVTAAISSAENLLDLKETETELISLGLLRPQKERVGGKKKETATPFRAYQFQGFKILSGRNNLQNDRLLKNCAPTDVWLHAQKYHSSHVIIVTEGRQVFDDVLLFAAEVCAYYSDGRAGGKVPIDYCERKCVKKPPKAKAGFVTYTQYKTLLVEPNRHTEQLSTDD
jgi:predicted ribosome quality control (RQC) complex YloA/Tae2 family protein